MYTASLNGTMVFQFNDPGNLVDAGGVALATNNGGIAEFDDAVPYAVLSGGERRPRRPDERGASVAPAGEVVHQVPEDAGERFFLGARSGEQPVGGAGEPRRLASAREPGGSVIRLGPLRRPAATLACLGRPRSSEDLQRRAAAAFERSASTSFSRAEAVSFAARRGRPSPPNASSAVKSALAAGGIARRVGEFAVRARRAMPGLLRRHPASTRTAGPCRSRRCCTDRSPLAGASSCDAAALGRQTVPIPEPCARSSRLTPLARATAATTAPRAGTPRSPRAQDRLRLPPTRPGCAGPGGERPQPVDPLLAVSPPPQVDRFQRKAQVAGERTRALAARAGHHDARTQTDSRTQTRATQPRQQQRSILFMTSSGVVLLIQPIRRLFCSGYSVETHESFLRAGRTGAFFVLVVCSQICRSIARDPARAAMRKTPRKGSFSSLATLFPSVARDYNRARAEISRAYFVTAP